VTPVLYILCSRCSSSSSSSADENEAESRRHVTTRQSSANHTAPRQPLNHTHPLSRTQPALRAENHIQQTTRPLNHTQSARRIQNRTQQTTHPPNHTQAKWIPLHKRSPSIEIVVDSDAEVDASQTIRRRAPQARRTPNNHHHRPAITTPAGCWPAQQAGRLHDDERLAEKYYELRRLSRTQPTWCVQDRTQEKYYELRRLILDRLDLRTLTPQVRPLTYHLLTYFCCC